MRCPPIDGSVNLLLNKYMGGPEAITLARSVHNWWSLAGVDTLVGETPADWLGKLRPPAATTTSAAPRETGLSKPTLIPSTAPQRAEAPAPPPPVHMPDDWDAFQAWLLSDAQVPGCEWDSRRLATSGKAGAPLMIISACPEIDEQAAGELFTGATGHLFKAMLAAIGLGRDQCYLASLAQTRPPGGRFDDEMRGRMTPLLWHHLKLARPQRLLLVGNEITAMAMQSNVASMRGKLRDINHDGVTVSAAAILHPALLLARPAMKAAAWDSLKHFKQG